MRKTGIAAVALSAVLSASAGAEDWTGVGFPGMFFSSETAPVCLGPSGVRVTLSAPGAQCPAGYLADSGSAPFLMPLYSVLPSGAGHPQSSLGVEFFGAVPDASVASGYVTHRGRLLLSEFARSDTVNSLASRVSAVEAGLATMPSASDLSAINARISSAESDLAALATFIPEALQDMQKEARAGAAMAASLETVAPAAGSKNRLGFNSANYNGETAFSVSYVRQEGQIDVSAGVAISGDEAMVKGGIGLSW
jgi:hypothetical protein